MIGLNVAINQVKIINNVDQGNPNVIRSDCPPTTFETGKKNLEIEFFCIFKQLEMPMSLLMLLLDDVIPFSVIIQRHIDGWGPRVNAIKKT